MNKKIFKSEFLRQQWLLYFITIISLLITSSVRIVGYNILKRAVIEYGYTMHVQGYGLLLALSLLSVVLIPIIMFNYMHSKEKLDLFHSLPITRTNLFLNKYLIGLAYFTISYFLTALVMFTIDKIYCPDLTSLNLGYFLFLIKNWIFFVLIYTVFALANAIMGITVYAVFCGILLFFTPFMLYDTYLALYASLNVSLNTPSLTSNFFSYYFDDLVRNDLMDTSQYIMLIVSMAILIVLILFSAISIYNKRDSEKSKTSVAVRKFEIPLKTLILYFVFITTLFIMLNSTNLLMFSVLIISPVVIVISSFIVEIVFDISIKNLNYKSLLYSTLSALLILTVVFLTVKVDIFDTKHYVPPEESVNYLDITYTPPYYDSYTEYMLLSNEKEIQKFYELTDELIEVSSHKYYDTDNLLFKLEVEFITNDTTYTRYFYFENENLANEVLNIPDNAYANSLSVASDLLNNDDISVYFDAYDDTYSFYYTQNVALDLDNRYPYDNGIDNLNYLAEENIVGEELVAALSTDISKILINNPAPQNYIPLMTYYIGSSIHQGWPNSSYLDSGTLYLTNEYVETLKFLKDNDVKIEERTYSVYKITDRRMLNFINNLIDTDDSSYYSYPATCYYSYKACEYIKENMELVDTFNNFDKEKTLNYTVYTEIIDDETIMQADTYILLNEYIDDIYQPNYRFVKKVK